MGVGGEELDDGFRIEAASTRKCCGFLRFACLSQAAFRWLKDYYDATECADAEDSERTRESSLPKLSNYNPMESTMSTFIRSWGVHALIASAAFLAISPSAWAVDVKVKLTGAEEMPPVTTSASGTGTITITADKSVSGTFKTAGIDGTMAHIHVGAPGQNGPPIITLSKGAAGVWSVPAGSQLTDEQYASFKAGNLYVNVHSAEHKPGEIRGQLKP